MATTVTVVDDVIQVATVGMQGPSGTSSETIRLVSADYTILITDECIFVDSTAGNITLTLPDTEDAYDATSSTGRIFDINKIYSPNTVTVRVKPASGDTILGDDFILMTGKCGVGLQAYHPFSLYSFI